jgi:hypothetical protein
MKRRIALLAALLLVGLLVASTTGLGSSDSRKIVAFDVMAPVSEPFTGATNAIRGVPGGGLPWELDAAKGELRADGRLEVEIEGLVLARRAPVPEVLQGTNPIASFKAIVSCLTVDGGSAATVNVSTTLAPASPSGDAKIEDSLVLPSPCFAPVVFVTSPGGMWFAVTGR